MNNTRCYNVVTKRHVDVTGLQCSYPKVSRPSENLWCTHIPEYLAMITCLPIVILCHRAVSVARCLIQMSVCVWLDILLSTDWRSTSFLLYTVHRPEENNISRYRSHDPDLWVSYVGLNLSHITLWHFLYYVHLAPNSVIRWLSSYSRTWRDTRCHDISWILSGRRGWRRLVSASVCGVVDGRCLEW